MKAQDESFSYFTEQVKKYLDFKERIDPFRQRCERISLTAFDSCKKVDHSHKEDFVLEHQEKLLKLRTEIAKTEAKENVWRI